MLLPLLLLLLLGCQVREHKSALANYETQDMGKPIDEAEWDMVSETLGGGVVGGVVCRLMCGAPCEQLPAIC